jgi:plastocyanin
VLQLSSFAIGEANGGTATASGAPVTSAAPAPSAGASGAPAPSGGAAADVSIQAKDIQFVERTFTAPGGQPFTIGFDNQDAGTPHNIDIKDASGASVFKGAIFNGVATKVYQVPALPAGSYTYVCDVHPTMTGTATLQ